MLSIINSISFDDILNYVYFIVFNVISIYVLYHYKFLKELRYGVLLLCLLIVSFVLAFSHYFFNILSLLLFVYIWIEILRIKKRQKKRE